MDSLDGIAAAYSSQLPAPQPLAPQSGPQPPDLPPPHEAELATFISPFIHSGYTRIHLSLGPNGIIVSTWDFNGTIYIPISSSTIDICPGVTTELLQEVFICDVRKDSKVKGSVKKTHLETFKNACGFKNITDVNDMKPITRLEGVLKLNGRTWHEWPNLVKDSTSGGLGTQILDSTQYDNYGLDCGPYGTTVFKGTSLPEIISTVASMLDSATTSVINSKFWPPLQGSNDKPNLLTIDSAVCERLGLPLESYISCFASRTAPGTSPITYNYCFSAEMFPNKVLHDTITQPGDHLNSTFKNFLKGNAEKNKAINKDTTSPEDRLKHLLFKELGDLLGLLFFTIFSKVENKRTITLSVDKTWLYRAMVYGEKCLCTGIIKGKKKGHSNYWLYTPSSEPYTMDMVRTILGDSIIGLLLNILNHNMLQMHYLKKLKTGLETKNADILTCYTIMIKNIMGTGRQSKTPSKFGGVIKQSVPTNLARMAKAVFVFHPDEPNEPSQDTTIRAHIIQQIEDEITKIETITIPLLKQGICAIRMIADSIGTDYDSSSSSNDNYNPTYVRGTSTSNVNIDANLRAGLKTYIQTNIGTERPPPFTKYMLLNGAIADLFTPDLITSVAQTSLVEFMTLPLGTSVATTKPEEAMNYQIAYINNQLELASSNIFTSAKCEHYVTVLVARKYNLNNPTFLCYGNKLYKPNEAAHHFFIGIDSIRSIPELIDKADAATDALASVNYKGGTRRETEARRLEALRMKALTTNHTTSNQARSSSNLSTASRKAAAADSKIVARNTTVAQARLSGAPSYIAVEPMCALLFKAYTIYNLYADWIDVDKTLGKEFIQIFYDVLVDKYSNDIHTLASNLIEHYSEEHINEVGSLLSDLITYNGEPQVSNYNISAELEKLKTKYQAEDEIAEVEMPDAARGRRYKTKKIKQIKRSKKIKQIERSKRSKKRRQSRQSRQSKQSRQTRQTRQSRQSRQSRQTKKIKEKFNLEKI
jgi:hypothetical protein